MSESNSVVDLAARAVLERLGPELRRQFEPIIAEVRIQAELEAANMVSSIRERAEADAAARIREIAAAAEKTLAVPAKKDAKNRAWRTSLQGLAATVVVAVLTAFADVLGGDSVDLLSGAGWKVVLGTVSGAAVMAVLSYVQRLVNPPKE